MPKSHSKSHGTTMKKPQNPRKPSNGILSSHDDKVYKVNEHVDISQPIKKRKISFHPLVRTASGDTAELDDVSASHERQKNNPGYSKQHYVNAYFSPSTNVFRDTEDEPNTWQTSEEKRKATTEAAAQWGYKTNSRGNQTLNINGITIADEKYNIPDPSILPTIKNGTIQLCSNLGNCITVVLTAYVISRLFTPSIAAQIKDIIGLSRGGKTRRRNYRSRTTRKRR